MSHFWSFSGVTLLGTGRGVEAWRKGDDVLPQTSLFLPAAGGTGSWMDSAGRQACRRHRDEFKVPWKFESWTMQTEDSILTSCSVLASSSDLASLSPYLSPPRVSFSPSSCLVPSRPGHRESGAMLKSSVILTLPALHRTQYKTEILPPGAVRFPRYPRLCVYCIRRLNWNYTRRKWWIPSSQLCSSSGGGGSRAPGNLKFSVRPRPRGRCGRCQPGGWIAYCIFQCSIRTTLV